jgi:hypothetical protein
MKLSREEQKEIAEYRAKIVAAKSRDIIQLLDDSGYDTSNIENLKKQLEAGKISAPELFINAGNNN